jgi:HEAT repeats
MVKLLETDDDSGAMLLERCLPGTALRSELEPAQDVRFSHLGNSAYSRTLGPMFRPLVQAALFLFCWFACSVSLAAKDDLSALLSRFRAEHDAVSKEAILRSITAGYADAGPALLKIASETENVEMARHSRIGDLNFRHAAPLMKESLRANSHVVRANTARALGEFHDSSAVPDLIRAIAKEEDNGVIEQSALALQTLGVREALPTLKFSAKNPSPRALKQSNMHGTQ